MTATTTEPVTTRPADYICCRWCGVGLPEPPEGARWFAGSFGARGDRSAGLGVCPACSEVNDRAVQIAYDLPAEQRSALGEAPALRIAELLHALAIIDADPDQPPTFWEPAAFYLRETRAVLALEWADQYVHGGVATREDSCAAAPFSWVDARRVAAALSAAQTEQEAVGEPHTVRLPPPLGGGCAFCGLDGIEADAVAVYRAGGPVKAARSGWRTKRHGVQRWACPACAAAGGSTPTKTATAAAVAASGLAAEVERTGVLVPTFAPWFSTGAEPSPEPWAHVGGVDAIRVVVQDALTPPPEPPTLAELAARIERLEALLAGR